MGLKSFVDTDLENKKVLARFDFNVPIKNNIIKDSSRIDLALPTIELLLEKNISKLVMMSRLGRPQGQVVPELSLEPIAHYIAEKLGIEVYLSESATDSGIKTLLNLGHIKIIMLENLRFHPQETAGDNEFAKILSEYGDIYINDAFGVCHRKHSSVYQLPNLFSNQTTFAGPLIQKEISSLTKLIEKPSKPFICVLGGAKVKDKINTLEKLLIKADKLLIGGAMAYPFLKAKGINIGNSLCSNEDVSIAKNLLSRDKGSKIILPVDHIVAAEPNSKPKVQKTQSIDDGQCGFDIGPETQKNYQEHLASAQTIFWNGPMGLFETENFSQGTFFVAEVISKTNAFSVVGGGDSVSAINKSGFAQHISHVSTGGGASLEFIEKGSLPAIQILKYTH